MRLAIGLAAACAALSATTSGAPAMPAYKWTSRPLVVFADGEGSTLLAKQRQIVAAHRAALAERDVVVIWVVGTATSADLGAPPVMSAAALRSRYGVAAGAFRAVLVGKDGGVKLSSARPLGIERLSRTIDAMPMRRDEMRRR